MRTKYKGDEMEEIKVVVEVMTEIVKYYKFNNNMTIEKFNDICKKIKN